LRQIVQPCEQGKRIADRAQGGDPQTGGYSEPVLLAERDADSIRHPGNVGSHGGASSGTAVAFGGDLNGEVPRISKLLNDQIAAVKAGGQTIRDQAGVEVSVINSCAHRLQLKAN